MTMNLYPIFAIDPGPTQSGWVLLESPDAPAASGVEPNDRVRERSRLVYGTLALEMIASYGMPVGSDVFATCVEIGRFVEVCPVWSNLYTRIAVKSHICHSARATDSNIRQALLDRYGGKERAVGTKRSPGPLYGVKSHAWAALAVACCVVDGLEPMRVMT